MRKEIYFGIAIEIIGNGSGVGLEMLGYINPMLGWAIIGISNIAGIALIVSGIKKKDEVIARKDEIIAQKWEHYNKLTDLILSLETAPHKEWTTIVAKIQRELNAIGDKTLNKYMALYFSVIDEDEYVGIKPSRASSQKIIDLTREYMIRKYKR